MVTFSLILLVFLIFKNCHNFFSASSRKFRHIIFEMASKSGLNELYFMNLIETDRGFLVAWKLEFYLMDSAKLQQRCVDQDWKMAILSKKQMSQTLLMPQSLLSTAVRYWNKLNIENSEKLFAGVLTIVQWTIQAQKRNQGMWQT